MTFPRLILAMIGANAAVATLAAGVALQADERAWAASPTGAWRGGGAHFAIVANWMRTGRGRTQIVWSVP